MAFLASHESPFLLAQQLQPQCCDKQGENLAEVRWRDGSQGASALWSHRLLSPSRGKTNSLNHKQTPKDPPTTHTHCTAAESVVNLNACI